MKKAHKKNHMFAMFAMLLKDAIVLVNDPFRVFRLFGVPIWRMVIVISWYLMSEVLFSSLQFKFAQCHTWVKKKKVKHKKG